MKYTNATKDVMTVTTMRHARIPTEVSIASVIQDLKATAYLAKTSTSAKATLATAIRMPCAQIRADHFNAHAFRASTGQERAAPARRVLLGTMASTRHAQPALKTLTRAGPLKSPPL